MNPADELECCPICGSNPCYGICPNNDPFGGDQSAENDSYEFNSYYDSISEAMDPADPY